MRRGKDFDLISWRMRKEGKGKGGENLSLTLSDVHKSERAVKLMRRGRSKARKGRGSGGNKKNINGSMKQSEILNDSNGYMCKPTVCEQRKRKNLAV